MIDAQAIELRDPPQGWERKRIGEIADIIKEQIEPIESPNKLFNYLSIENIESESGKLVGFQPKRGKEIHSAKLLFTSGDVLYSRLRPYLNKVYIPSFEGISATDLLPIRTRTGIMREFLAYYLRTSHIVEFLNSRVHGINLPRVSVDDILATPIPLPPSKEQQRIVTKIEELITKVDAGIESLKRAKEQLVQYRHSVLKDAFEGNPTEYWRKSNPSVVREGYEFLSRVRAERRLETKGKVETSVDIIAAPSEWARLHLDSMTRTERNAIKRGPFGSMIKKESFVKVGFKVYEQKNVIYNDFKKGSYYIDKNKFEQMKDFHVASGDILITCSGTIGRIAVVPTNSEKGIINQALLKLSLDPHIILNGYFVYLFRSPVIQRIISTRGSAITNISSVGSLRAILFPVPSIEEQTLIVDEIERRMSVIERIEHAIQIGVERAKNLRQSILKSAFDGKLISNSNKDRSANSPNGKTDETGRISDSEVNNQPESGLSVR